MKPTKIAGDIKVANTKNTQTLDVNLADAGLRLAAQAALADNVLTVRDARLSAGKSSVRVTGNASLKDRKPFKANAIVSRFNPADFGTFPQADINAEINAAGALVPQWKVAADFAVRPSRLFNQPLSGRGKLDADATHVHDVDATLALGQNTVGFRFRQLGVPRFATITSSSACFVVLSYFSWTTRPPTFDVRS